LFQAKVVTEINGRTIKVTMTWHRKLQILWH